MIGFVPVTEGEVLYQTLVEQFVDDGKQLTSALNVFSTGRFVGRRSAEFSEYYFGIYCFNITARLIKAASAILREPSLHEPLFRGSMLGFLINQFEISEFRYGRNRVNLLVNLAFNAANSSGQAISKTTKERVLAGSIDFSCYICGCELLIQSTVPEQVLQYEHIWPSSFGGSSIVDNLLPACSTCNNKKGALMLWQDAPVSSIILPPNPSQNDLTMITRRAKIAKHRQDLFAFAVKMKITLKAAALQLGAYNFSNVSSVDSDDSADFFTLQF
jgi:hypothetical protein